jgi:hypothetical protein
VHLIGAGLASLPGGQPVQFSLVMMLRVPAHVVGQQNFRIEAVDENGHRHEAVPQVSGQFEVSADRDEDLPSHVPTSTVLPLRIQATLPERSYVQWRLWINDETRSTWQAALHTT